MTHEQISLLKCGDYISHKYGVFQFRSHIKALDNEGIIIGAKVFRFYYFKRNNEIDIDTETEFMSYDSLRRSEKIPEVNNGK